MCGIGSYSAYAQEPVANVTYQASPMSDPAISSSSDVNGSDSLPDPGWILADNAFYGLKVGIENLQLALKFNQTEKAKMELKFADERLAEIKKEVDKGDVQSAAKAESEHQKLIDDLTATSEKQSSDNRGVQIRAIIQQALQDHDDNTKISQDEKFE